MEPVDIVARLVFIAIIAVSLVELFRFACLYSESKGKDEDEIHSDII